MVKILITRKNVQLCVVMGANQINCGDHFIIYKYTEALSYTSEAKIMLYAYYNSI